VIERRLPDTPFWVDPESVGPDLLTLSPEESHHLLHVHRARTGTPFQAIDGEGHFFECVVESVGRRAAVGRIVARRANVGELSRPIEILVGMPDWGAMEQIVAHGVPLGVCAFDFFPCERSGRLGLGPQRLARLGRIARAALKQCRRSRLPAIRASGSIEEAAGALQISERFFADPEGNRAARAGAESPEDAVSLAVGPPGGFTERERGLLLDQRFSPISLGPSRLTTETAALALISLARNSL
jgi:16S rRNA (uracil1498-N3)-methyltransferase